MKKIISPDKTSRMSALVFSEALTTSFKELFKYKVIQSINTGDRAYDSLLQTFFLTVITAVVGYFSYDKIKEYFPRWFGKEKDFKNNEIVEKRKNNFKYVTWTISNSNFSFTKKAKVFVSARCPPHLQCVSRIDPNTGCPADSQELFPSSITKDVFIVLHTDSFGNVAGITGYKDGDHMFFYETDNVLSELLTNINNIRFTKSECLRIKSGDDDDTKNTLYSDRNMDLFVSRHKPTLISVLDNFLKTNASGKSFGGYGMFNIGMILYGPPGTGKTFAIKAVCNYLKRHAVIIDMRRIKTRRNFVDIFTDKSIKNNVFVLDEFDIVQGVISNRDQSQQSQISEDPEDKRTEKLKKRQIELMKLLSGGDGDGNPLIAKELEAIAKSISDQENSLTLDTILQVLDGMVEHRGRVIIATTNYIDRIDRALLREGRFGLKLELGAFNDSEAHELLEKMFSETASPTELELLKVTKIKENTYTPAQLINLGISIKNLTEILKIVQDESTSEEIPTESQEGLGFECEVVVA